MAIGWDTRRLAGLLMVCAVGALVATAAHAQVDPNSGIDFVRVGAVGNAAWAGDGTVGDRAVGRGSVGYEYSIGKFEVTTAQWAEFFNAAFDRPAGDALPHVVPPTYWGAAGTTPINSTNPNARRWTVPVGNEMTPVGNISWRMAAMYCNWLHNDKATNREAFLNGAYDASTFTFTPGGRFRDQQTRSPGARYWVPSWDEWLKAAHYDPNKANPDGTTGGWWKYGNGSDVPFVAGPPGVLVNGVPTTSNFNWDGTDFPTFSPLAVSLGAYGNVTSPWGLYDVSGATAEWTEECFFQPGDTFPHGREYDGGWWYDGGSIPDWIGSPGGTAFPSLSTFDLGFRIASNVPCPSVFVLGVIVVGMSSAHRRRTTTIGAGERLTAPA